MPAKSIPKEVREQINAIVDRFNRDELADSERSYIARFRGKYLYLDRKEYDNVGPICRLEYTGDTNKWRFAIYKYSSERYDPDEYFFPGEECVDGTVEGAMKAGMRAYN